MGCLWLNWNGAYIRLYILNWILNKFWYFFCKFLFRNLINIWSALGWILWAKFVSPFIKSTYEVKFGVFFIVKLFALLFLIEFTGYLFTIEEDFVSCLLLDVIYFQISITFIISHVILIIYWILNSNVIILYYI